MFAYIVPANSYPAQTGVAKDYWGEKLVPYRAYWALKTAQEDVAMWAPSGSDSLAEDWIIMKERELNFGEKLVGITFNPSGDEKVNRAKELCAELANLIYQDYDNREEVTDFYDYLYEHAVGEILNAQMNAVKVLTFKY